MGPPGSGRRTQTLCLAGCLGVTPITWRDLPAEALGDAALGRAVAGGGFVLSGYPRTPAEAQALDVMLADHGVALDAVIVLNVQPSLRLHRIARDESLEAGGRPVADPSWQCQLRNEQSVYTRRTVPVLELYRSRGILDAVDGVGAVADVTLRLAASLHAQRYARMFSIAANG